MVRRIGQKVLSLVLVLVMLLSMAPSMAFADNVSCLEIPNSSFSCCAYLFFCCHEPHA